MKRRPQRRALLPDLNTAAHQRNCIAQALHYYREACQALRDSGAAPRALARLVSVRKSLEGAEHHADRLYWSAVDRNRTAHQGTPAAGNAAPTDRQE